MAISARTVLSTISQHNFLFQITLDAWRIQNALLNTEEIQVRRTAKVAQGNLFSLITANVLIAKKIVGMGAA